MVPYLQAVFSATAILIAIVGILIFLVFYRENDRSAKYWFTGCILMASGMVVLLTRNYLPVFIGYAVNNFIMIYAMVLFRDSFWIIEQPKYKPPIYPLLFSLYHGLLIWGLTFTSYATEIGTVAAINWTALYVWLFYDSILLQKKVNNHFFRFFPVITFFGIIAWGVRIFITLRFDIVSASDQQSLNALSLLFAHIVLIAAQLIYIIVRLTDEKNKKLLIAELNSNLELLWTEKEVIQKERTSERKSLLRDIHDGFGSQLASLRILIDKDRVSKDEISSSLTALSSDLHLIVDTLSSDDLSVADAISDMRYRLRYFSGANSTQIKWNVDIDTLPKLDPRTILHVMRITQEAITNSLRHSHANTISVDFRYDRSERQLIVCVIDDGIGIKSQMKSGRGLNNMASRATEIHGILSIDNLEDPSGTKVSLIVPIS